MKTHTQTFKENLITLGKEINAKVTYTINGTTTELDGENLASVTPHFKGNILKSVMKQVDIVSDIDIPLETQINVQFGMKYDSGSFEYINFGNYIVYSSEKQEDTNNYKIVAYDKMLYAMKDYEELSITYPCTIKQFIIKLAQNMGLGASLPNDFVNQDRELTQDVFVGLGYTKRDVLDQLAEVTASTICINNEDTLEIRYLQDNINATSTASGSSLSFNADDEDFILELLGNTTQDGTPTPDTPIPINVVSGDNTIDICGKNLLNPFINYSAGYSTTHNGITYTINSDGSITANGTATSASAFTLWGGWSGTTTYLKLDASKTYRLSEANGGLVYLRTRKNGTNSTHSSQSTTGRVFTGETDVVSFDVQVGSGTTLNNYVFKPMLEVGSTATTYEPYKGKSYPIYLGVENLIDTIDIYNGFTGGAVGNTITYTASANTITYKKCAYVEAGQDYILYWTPNTPKATGNREIRITDSEDKVLQIKSYSNANNNTSTIISPTSNGWVYACLDANATEVVLQKGTTIQHLSTTPIELCKIGTYQDKIFKGKGVNLFDKDNVNVLNAYFSTGQTTIANNEANRTIYIPCEPNTTYTMQKINSAQFYVGYTRELPVEGVQVYGITNTATIFNTNYKYITFTTDSNARYIVSRMYQTAQDTTITFQQVCNTIQIEKGSTATEYEPYGAKDKWLLHKEIGKVVLDGSENWTYGNTSTYQIFYTDLINYLKISGITCLSNYYYGASNNTGSSNAYSKGNNAISLYIGTSTSVNRIYIRNDNITSASDFQTWLQSHNTIVYYVLATPTTTEITNSELIKDLEKPKLLMGLNNIASDSPLNIEYVSDYETIDEDYIKNNRVDFGEKYGPVNSIVLSRSADSDNVYLKDQESIDENGLCEIKIKNNQVMNDNDRSDYLPEILNKLKGLSYYINDFESIGITYLDLCDKYKVKIGDTKYSCVMFNDEVQIENGLNELIYTDKPEMSQTDYRKASESDKAEKQTYLIVDKQAQRIDAVVSTQEEFDESLSQLTIDVDGIQTKVELNYDFVREVEHTNNVSSEEMQKEGLIQLSIKGTAISSNYLRLNISNNTQTYVDLPITTILYQDEDTYDELSIENIYNEETGAYEYHTFITKKLDYIDNTIVQRSTSNNYLLDETTTPITTESSEQLLLDDFHLDKQDLGVLDLQIDDGIHTFSINGYNNLQYYLKYIIVNNITSDLVQSRHIISEINQSAEEIQINADKVSLQGKEINLTSDDIVINSDNFKVDKDGNMTCSNAKITGGELDISSSLAQPRVKIREKVGNIDFINNIGGYGYAVRDLTNSETLFGTTLFTDLMTPTKLQMLITLNKDNKKTISMTSGTGRIDCKQLILFDDNEQSKIYMYGSTGNITCVTLSQTSLEEAKKNFEKLNNALDIVKDVDIYKYNFKFEENYDKKHIGFVIGDKFKYRREITNSKNDGAELYSMIGVLYKAVQEQQEQIEELKKEIDILKGGK